NAWITDFSEWQLAADWIKPRRAEFLERFPSHLNPQALKLLNRLEETPAIALELAQGAPTCLLHGDFHLDNILFEPNDRPVFLDWSRPAKGSPAYNLIQTLIFMAPLEQFDQELNTYLDVFNQHAPNEVDLETLKGWLDAEFLRAFTTSTCGIARWRPTDERGKQIIEDTVEKVNAAAAFWGPRLKNIGSL
ncbi:MAG: phosphotransferase, partial [Chloroflexota bacterium]